MKKFLIGFGAVLALVIAVALVAPFFVDLNDYKAEIAAGAREATGRDLAIDGDIRLSLLPTPSLNVGRVRLANLPGAGPADMATIESIDVRVALGPLLSGNIQVERVVIVRPVIELVVLPDGRTNWQFQAAAGGDDAAESPGGGVGADIRLDRVVIEDGTLIYRDMAAGTTERFDDLAAEISARSLKGPFEFELSARARGVAFTVAGTSEAIDRAPIPVRATITLPEAKTSMEFNGRVTALEPPGRMVGKLRIEAASLADLIAVVAKSGAAADAPTAPALARPFLLETEIDAGGEAVALKNLTLRLGEISASGSAEAVLSPELTVDIALAVNQIDLDALLAEVTPAEAPAETAGTAALAGLEIPTDVNVRAKLDIGAVTWRDNLVREVKLDVKLGGGVATLNRAQAQLPGGMDVALAGAARTDQSGPRFDGRLTASSGNLRALFDWLEIDTTGIAADRLRKLEFAATVAITPEVAQVYGIDMVLDSTAVKGGVSYALRARPSFSVDLVLDRLNADAYLPPAGARPAPGDGAGAETPASPFAVLDTFDTNAKLKIGTLTYGGLPVEGLDLDLSLVGGTLTVTKLTVANFAGTAIGLSGQLKDAETDPVFEVNANIRSNDLGGLGRLAGVDLPALGRLGRTDIQGSVKGRLDAFETSFAVTTRGTRLDLTGSVKDALGEPRFDTRIQARIASVAELARTFDPAAVVPKGAAGKATFTGAIKGGLDALDLDLALELAKARMSAKGKVEGGRYGLRVTLDHPSLIELVRTLGLDYRPAARKLGPVQVRANLSGDAGQVAIRDFDGRFGPANVVGTADLDLARAVRPYLKADLQASEVIIDLFLPAAAQAGAGGGAQTPGQRWSTEPFDASGLAALDADITVAAVGIDYGGYAFGRPRARVSLENGVLTVPDLTAKLFDGDVKLTATVRHGGVPSAELQLELVNADLGQAVRAVAGSNAISGRFGLTGAFTARGRSELEMVRNLNGSARLTAGPGVIRGLDLKRLSDRLKNLSELIEYLDLVAATTSGGETRLIDGSGTWVVENGIARSQDTVLNVEAGQGRITGIIDLPVWQLDIKSRYQLIEHPKAPLIGVDLKGPIDNPRRTVRTRDLERYIATRVGGGVLRKLGVDKKLPGILGGGAATEGGGAQQPLIDPQQLLEGLFGKKKKKK